MEKILLNTGWLFKHIKSKVVKEFLPADVPGTVYTDLLKNKLIPDPFIGKNEKRLQRPAIANKDWIYKKEFSVKKEFLSFRKILLVFEGIDTFAEIYLNKKLLGKSENMFHPYVFEVKDILKEENVLEVKIYSPTKHLKKIERNYGLVLNGVFFNPRCYGRKAQYSFGWDWGPFLPTSGLWKDIYLLGYNRAKIDNIFVKQLIVSKEKASLEIQIEIDTLIRDEFSVDIEITDGETLQKKSLILHSYERFNLLRTEFEINNPKLWYPNGYGEPFLYTLEVKLSHKGEPMDEYKIKFGLRKIELVQEKDTEGRSFIFKINDIPIFCKGMNWIPSDSFLTRITKEKYRKQLLLMKDANMNMVRVWGGGIYEDDEFYNTCDELGIMVWQDFMSACQEVPDHLEWFRESFKQEAIYQIKRLRNHPSIVLWCGNNENEGVKYGCWGTPKRERYYGEKIFYQLLPELCYIYDSTRPYLPSSPWGDEDCYNSQPTGDFHSYAGWSGGDWKKFGEVKGRFISEIGYQSFPDIETVRSFCVGKIITINRQEILAHEKALDPKKAIEWIKFGVENLLGFKIRKFKKFNKFVYLSQVSWAEGTKFCIEHWRRRKFNTAGILFWQLNDCWPVISWSFIDYYLRPKLCYYSAKRAFAPVILSPVQEDNRIKVFLINDRLTSFHGRMVLKLINFWGKEFIKKEIEIETEENSNKIVFDDKIEIKDPSGQVLILHLFEGTKEIHRNYFFFKSFKELNLKFPEIEIKTNKIKTGQVKLTLKSPTFIPAIKISTDNVSEYSDNYIFLLPEEEKEIEITSTENIKHLTIESLYFRRYIQL